MKIKTDTIEREVKYHYRAVIAIKDDKIQDLLIFDTEEELKKFQGFYNLYRKENKIIFGFFDEKHFNEIFHVNVDDLGKVAILTARVMRMAHEYLLYGE